MVPLAGPGPSSSLALSSWVSHTAGEAPEWPVCLCLPQMGTIGLALPHTSERTHESLMIAHQLRYSPKSLTEQSSVFSCALSKWRTASRWHRVYSLCWESSWKLGHSHVICYVFFLFWCFTRKIQWRVQSYQSNYSYSCAISKRALSHQRNLFTIPKTVSRISLFLVCSHHRN